MNLDTLEISHDLQERGFTPIQAEGIIGVAMTQNANMVTQDFLKVELSATKFELQTQIGQVKSELQTQMGQVKSELETKIVQVKSELKAAIDQGRAEQKVELAENKVEFERRMARFETLLVATKVDMIKWAIGLHLMSLGVMFAFIKLIR